MKAAKEAAILAGDVDEKDGMPFLEVDGDGGWGVRSYNHSMRSPVGWVKYNLKLNYNILFYLNAVISVKMINFFQIHIYNTCSKYIHSVQFWTREKIKHYFSYCSFYRQFFVTYGLEICSTWARETITVAFALKRNS